MKLATEFVRLPYLFDVQKLQEEVLAFSEDEWLPHVQGFAGNSAIPLISLNGTMNNDFNGPMKVTEKLEKSPYLKQVLASFDEVFGRSRLMGLDGKCSVPVHRDVNYHWYNRVRIHIPILTNPDVIFYCGREQVHMAAGETWIFDAWKQHRVDNNSDDFRVHLVIDTAGSPKFWNTVAAAQWRNADKELKPASIEDQMIAFDEHADSTILTEQFNAPLVMHPGEIDALITDIIDDVKAFATNHPPTVAAFESMLTDFRHQWRRLWSLYGQTPAGWPHYQALIKSVKLPRTALTLFSNNGSAAHTVSARVFMAALNTNLNDQYRN